MQLETCMKTEDIYEKWLATGLLAQLDDEQARTMAQLLENQCQEMIRCEGKGPEYDRANNIAFPIVRRVFDPEGLAFTYSATPLPVIKSSEDAILATVGTFNIGVKLNFADFDDLRKNTYYALDAEVELTLIWSEAIREEFNERFKGQHIYFYVPLSMVEIARRNEEDPKLFGLRSRYTVMPEGGFDER